MVIPFKYEFVQDRWAQKVQLMLQKDEGDPRANRIRIIDLFDSQVNAGMHIFFGKEWFKKRWRYGKYTNRHTIQFRNERHRIH